MVTHGCVRATCLGAGELGKAGIPTVALGRIPKE
jgi:hypothetical protein